jgi:hypothetical protein
MMTRKVVDSITRDHGRKVTRGNCRVCFMELGIQNQTDYSRGNSWLCVNHK